MIYEQFTFMLTI